jgi:hypothetical protein
MYFLNKDMNMTASLNPLSLISSAPTLGKAREKAGSGHWFEAMSSAWGETLDKTAATIESMSNDISGGNDQPAAITALSTESLRMSFLSSSAHTSIASVGGALETMARKQ